ncbi:MAG TPA: retropepsin-like aspartic protease [Steroidobacteraceae bacterium]
MAAKINGQDAKFIVDSGTFFSSVSTGMTRALDLRVTGSRVYRFQLSDRRIERDRQSTNIKLVEFAGIQAKNLDFLVADNALDGTGLLGNDLLSNFDIEYDLDHASIVLIKTTGCLHANLAYWRDKQQSSSVMDFLYASDRSVSGTLVNDAAPSQLIEALMYVNGMRFRAVLDSGVFQSVFSLRGAGRAGVHPGSSGVVQAGPITGVGVGVEKSYVGTFDSVKLGENEELNAVRMRFADLDLGDADLLLGADFFLSHHILVSRAVHKIYFTQYPGEVFNIADAEPQLAVGAQP